MSCITDSFSKLRTYCENENFKGVDPYDGLNSRLLAGVPFVRRAKVFRLFWTQLLKTFPVDLRGILLVPPQYNAKGMALFISGYAGLMRTSGHDAFAEKISYLTKGLSNMRSPGYKEACWGYNFDWQSRAFFLPKGAPNVVVSAFAGGAFLDAFEAAGKEEYLDRAVSACDFILERLNRSVDAKGNFCFSYSPGDRSVIFNASLLASELLSRVYKVTGRRVLAEEAKRSVEFCCGRQNEDGSWFYGAAGNQRWIDSFHTSYNLWALHKYAECTGDNAYKDNFDRGLRFYIDNFFTAGGMPKYYHDSAFPIDVHSTAGLIVLSSKAGLMKRYKDLIDKVLAWTIEHMQDEKGFFYYKMGRFLKVKIPYMRWSQAWMFYALACYIDHEKNSSEQ